MTELRHYQLVFINNIRAAVARGCLIREAVARAETALFFVHRQFEPARSNRHRSDPLRRLNKIMPPDLLIRDECRHVLADSYLKTLRRFKGARLLGLTAMPLRMGGQSLGARAQRAQDRSGRLRRRIEDFRAGRVKILCNAELFGEGLEVPEVGAAAARQ